MLKLNKFLNYSGHQLVESNERIEEFALAARGSKSTTAEEDFNEPESLKTEQHIENLKEMLRLERVTMSSKISKGVYELDKNRVKVTFQAGKWKVGFHEDNVKYLRPHEALQLMEMKQLEVTFDSVIMSIEQAYEIFLDPDNGVSFEEYLTYSYLIRAGYFVEQHNFASDKQKFEMSMSKQLADKEDEMIWCVLMEKLNLPVTSKLKEKEPEIYENTKKTMENLCEEISGKRYEDNSNQSSNPDEPPCKRMKYDLDEAEEQNFLDILKTETKISSYQEIYQKFNFIKRTKNFTTSHRKLKISFDVHQPKSSFKRTEDLASYRVVVTK